MSDDPGDGYGASEMKVLVGLEGARKRPTTVTVVPPNEAKTFAALERMGVDRETIAAVDSYLHDVQSGEQFAYDLSVIPYLPPEHLERHMRDVLDRVKKRPGMFHVDGADGLREGAKLLDEEAERVRGWLAVVARRKGVGEPNLDGVTATGKASIAGLNELAGEWRTAGD